MTQQANHPVKEFRVGTTKAAIWRNEVERDGQTVVQHSIKVQRSYQDPKTGDWKSQEMKLFPDHIPGMMLVLDETYKFCRLRESEEQDGLPTVAR